MPKFPFELDANFRSENGRRRVRAPAKKAASVAAWRLVLASTLVFAVTASGLIFILLRSFA